MTEQQCRYPVDVATTSETGGGDWKHGEEYTAKFTQHRHIS